MLPHTTTIPCACGCGTLIDPIGWKGNPRQFVPGHNLRPFVAARIIDRVGPIPPTICCVRCGVTKPSSEFYRRSRTDPWPQFHCKQCHHNNQSEASKQRYTSYKKAYAEEHRAELAAYKQTYRETHREQHKDWLREYEASHKTELAAKSRAYRQSHKQELAERKRAYYEANKDRNREKTRSYYELRRDDVIARVRDWRETHKDMARENARRASARRRTILSAPDLRCDLTTVQWREIQEAQGYRCAMCGEVHPLTQDHIIPLSRGGEHTASNIQALCRRCNSSKGVRILTVGGCQKT